MAATADKSKPYIPLAGLADDGWSKEDEATVTCFCGAVQLAFPTKAPDLLNTFVCHCSDCHKITASMYASNFTVLASSVTHIRGQSNLSQFAQSKTIASHKTMTNYFCKTCGTLMYRIGERWPDALIMRIGTVDDFMVQQTVLKPQKELFVENRLEWVGEIEGVEQCEGMGM